MNRRVVNNLFIGQTLIHDHVLQYQKLLEEVDNHDTTVNDLNP